MRFSTSPVTQFTPQYLHRLSPTIKNLTHEPPATSSSNILSTPRAYLLDAQPFLNLYLSLSHTPSPNSRTPTFSIILTFLPFQILCNFTESTTPPTILLSLVRFRRSPCTGDSEKGKGLFFNSCL